MGEQPALALEPSGVAGERAAGANDAMAGDGDADEVGVTCTAHGTRGTRLSHARGYSATGGDLGDAAELSPNGHLKLRTAKLELRIPERGQLAGEVGP